MPFLLFDIGGTNTRIALSPDGQKISEPVIFETEVSFEKGIQKIKEHVLALTKGEKLQAAAGGIPGVLDATKSILINPTNISNIPNWIGKQIRKELMESLDCPVFLENDAAMVGLGEAIHGAGVGKEIVAYVTISTGVGGARITNGKIDHRRLGFEVGHQIISPNGPICPPCKVPGHLEAYIGGKSLEWKYHQKPEDIKDPIIWDQVASDLAIGLTNITLFWSPDIIILGGAISPAIPLDKVKVHMKELLKIFPLIPEIKLATLGNGGGLLGSLEYLKQNLKI